MRVVAAFKTLFEIMGQQTRVVSPLGATCTISPTLYGSETLEFRVRGYTRSMLPACLGVGFIVTAIGLAASFNWRFDVFDYVLLGVGFACLVVAAVRFLLSSVVVIDLPSLDWRSHRSISGVIVARKSGSAESLEIRFGSSTYQGIPNAEGEAVVLVAGKTRLLVYSSFLEPNMDEYLAILPNELVNRVSMRESGIFVKQV